MAKLIAGSERDFAKVTIARAAFAIAIRIDFIDQLPKISFRRPAKRRPPLIVVQAVGRPAYAVMPVQLLTSSTMSSNAVCLRNSARLILQMNANWPS